MFVYKHKVHYYETDRMGVTHHSNYIRIMEEARVAYLDAIGASYAQITTFDDVIEVSVYIKSMTTFKLKIGYTMHCRGEEVFEGWSLHCFLDKENHPIPIAERYPQFVEAAR